MADTKANKTEAKAAPEGDETFSILDAGSFEQAEPKPADFPASAKVTHPLQQLNPALNPAVGVLAGRPETAEAIEEGVHLHAKSQAKGEDAAAEIADAKARLRDLETKHLA